MAQQRTITAATPRGTFTRKTHRIYTHVVTITGPHHRTGEATTIAATWCGRPDLAVKAVASVQKDNPGLTVEAFPVTDDPWATKVDGQVA